MVGADAGASLADDGTVRIDSIDLDGQGVARRPDGKVVFVEGALPGERVRVQVHRRKNQWEQGQASEVLTTSALRVTPHCPHFGLHAGACGGCKVQHLEAGAQVAVKQRVLEDQLWHLGKVRPDRILPSIAGPAWGYRQRARLSVRYVPKKGTVLVGFHERKSRYVADMQVCRVLPQRVSDLLMPLRELIGAMQLRDAIPQLELAMGDDVLALVVRHLRPVGEDDRARLVAFGQQHGVQWWLQPGGPQTVHRLDPDDGPDLAYALPGFDVQMRFRPTDFTQVNLAINRVLVERSLRLLAPQAGERIVDWFCGLGNFTLPIARSGAQVLGVEGSAALVERANENAREHGLAANARFAERNLFEISAEDLAALGTAPGWLVDPPREGAFALVRALAQCVHQRPAGWATPQRIVYVSCNPATLARDAGILVHVGGYRCEQAGVVNMFPHTAHVESMAVFTWSGQPGPRSAWDEPQEAAPQVA